MTTPNTLHYPDVPAFIYGITREIWEDRGVGGKLDKYYAPNCLVRAPTGLSIVSLQRRGAVLPVTV